MAQLATSEEWDLSALPSDRRDYLESNPRFEDIASFILKEAVCTRAEVCAHDDPGPPSGTRRIEFRIEITGRIYDLFFNSRDGLRGRYWQGPSIGEESTYRLIELLRPKLVPFAEERLKQLAPKMVKMDLADVCESLNARSAKVWVFEAQKFPQISGPELVVRRWKQNDPGGSWRWTPIDNTLDVKGAFLRPDGIEYVPEHKKHRAEEIHRKGFS